MADSTATHADVDAQLDRLHTGSHTPDDLLALRRALVVSGDGNAMQLGRYNVIIREGENVQVGDRFYFDSNAEEIRKIVREYEAFKPIYNAIQSRPENLDFTQSEMLEALGHIQDEVAKGERTNPDRLEFWLKAFQRMSPEIFDETAAILANPASGFSGAVRDVVNKVCAKDNIGDPFVLIRILTRRVISRRIEVISVGASAFVVTSLAGIANSVVALTFAQIVNFHIANVPLQFILLFGIQVLIGWIVGLASGLARVIAQPSHPNIPLLLRVGAIVGGFAVANALVAEISTRTFLDPASMVVGAMASSGIAVTSEWSLLKRQSAWRRILIASFGLALTTALASVAFIQMTLGIAPEDPLAIRWRFMGSLNPAIINGFPESLSSKVQYVFVSAVQGFIIGFGLAGGVAVGTWLAGQLEKAGQCRD